MRPLPSPRKLPLLRYGLFILEVVKAWIDPARKHPRTLHHLGRGHFMVAGRTIRLRSGKK